MPTIKDEYKKGMRRLNLCLSHSNYKEGDFTNSITLLAERWMMKLEELEKLAEKYGWEHWTIWI